MQALRDAAMKPVSTAAVGDGFPDIVVAFRGICIPLEVKDGSKSPSERRLTAAEQKWRDEWPGPYALVESPEEAVRAVLEHAKGLGVV
jgi:hypothetical protein